VSCQYHSAEYGAAVAVAFTCTGGKMVTDVEIAGWERRRK